MSYCISHSKDVDGLSSAALCVASGYKYFKLASYDNVIEVIKTVPDNAESLVVCDIGTNSTTEGEFIKLLKKFRKVTYIDHHWISDETKKAIAESGIQLVHDSSECASMLTYLHFSSRLKRGMEEVALYGAITDYMDNSRNAQKIMERKDRHKILLEATLLSHAIASSSIQFRERVVSELAKGRKPHQIRGVLRRASSYLRKLERIEKSVSRSMRIIGRIASVETKESATGNIAKILLSLSEVPVGVAYKKEKDGWYEVSLRGTSECRTHLGIAIRNIASELGGSGGGHERAAGCRIKKDRIQEMLERLNELV